jgi:LysM repeat protein
MQERPLLVTIMAVLVLVLLVFPLPLPNVMAQSTPPSPVDIVSAVNSLRTSNGIPALQKNAALMSSAQDHADYLASIHTTTHAGAGGTDETDRALAAGYGNENSIACDEAVATAQIATTVDYVINKIWGDYQHHDVVLLNSQYSDIGAGVAVGSDGRVYYTVVNCTGGSGRVNPTPGTITPGTGAGKTPEEEVTVVTVTPRENGSMIHMVATGETLWSIANAYGQTIEQLEVLNGLATPDPVIYVGQELLVRPAFTITPSPTITKTLRPATRTSRPTFTSRPTRATSTITPEPTPTQPPLVAVPEIDRRWFGIGLVIICGLGLLSVLASNIRSRTRDKKPSGEEPPKDKTE